MVAVFFGVLLVGALGVGIWVATHPLFPGMSPLPRPEARAVGDVVIDSGRDEAQLVFRLTVSVAGIPDGVQGVDPTAYLELDLDAADMPAESGDASPAALVEVEIADLDRAGSIRTMSPVLPGADVRFTLECDVGEACDRMFVVRIQRGIAVAADARLDISWRVTAELRHARGVTLAEPLPLAIELVEGGEDR